MPSRSRLSIIPRFFGILSDTQAENPASASSSSPSPSPSRDAATSIIQNVNPPATTLTVPDPIHLRGSETTAVVLAPASALSTTTAASASRTPTTTTTLFSPPPLPIHPPPARDPAPWYWRCHACHSVYRLGVTRRCLECSHTFCSSLDTLRPQFPRGPRRRAARRRPGTCRSEFDYAGWEAWGSWRREVLGQDPTRAVVSGAGGPRPSGVLASARARKIATLTGGGKTALFVARKHDCWLHCDYPSECHHEAWRAMRRAKEISAAPLEKPAEPDDNAATEEYDMADIDTLLTVLEAEAEAGEKKETGCEKVGGEYCIAQGGASEHHRILDAAAAQTVEAEIRQFDSSPPPTATHASPVSMQEPFTNQSTTHSSPLPLTSPLRGSSNIVDVTDMEDRDTNADDLGARTHRRTRSQESRSRRKIARLTGILSFDSSSPPVPAPAPAPEHCDPEQLPSPSRETFYLDASDLSPEYARPPEYSYDTVDVASGAGDGGDEISDNDDEVDGEEMEFEFQIPTATGGETSERSKVYPTDGVPVASSRRDEKGAANGGCNAMADEDSAVSKETETEGLVRHTTVDGAKAPHMSSASLWSMGKDADVTTNEISHNCNHGESKPGWTGAGSDTAEMEEHDAANKPKEATGGLLLLPPPTPGEGHVRHNSQVEFGVEADGRERVPQQRRMSSSVRESLMADQDFVELVKLGNKFIGGKDEN